MGANNFVAFATVPAGAQVGAQASVDLWTLVPATGLDPGFNLMCSGEFVGTIAVEGSLDGTQFNPVASFTLGGAQQAPGVGATEPVALQPVVVDEVVRYLRLRVMPGTVVTSAVFVTAGGAANCDCAGTGGVASVVAGTGISVNAADPANPIVSNTGVLSVTAGAGITVGGTAANPTVALTGAPYTLASLYTAGLGISDAANTLVGATFNTFFTDAGAIDVSETGSGAYAETLRKHSTSTPGVTLIQQALVTKMDFVGGVNTAGGVGRDFAIENQAGAANTFGTEQVNLFAQSIPATWYSPSISAAGSPPISYIRWFLQNRRGSGAQSQVYFNSDGVAWRQSMFPASGGPYILYADQIAMNPTAGGGAEPEVGSTIRHVSTGPATGPDDGVPVSIAGHDEVMTAKNLGSAQIAGRFDVVTATLTGGLSVRASYSATSLGMVDVVSASQDFKTATTFTVVPQSTGVQARVGSRFLPIAAYVEFTSIAALATGPSLKLGNNVAHDNVAPNLVVSNAAVTDNAIPFVMAATPSVIDLTATGIICEITVNAAGTTCTGRLHVIGAYVNVT